MEWEQVRVREEMVGGWAQVPVHRYRSGFYDTVQKPLVGDVCSLGGWPRE